MDLDLLILFIFLIAVTYVVIQAVNSLGKQTLVEFDGPNLAEQLKERELNGKSLDTILDFKFKFDDRYAFTEDESNPAGDKQPRFLQVTIINKTDTVTIFMDWDKCTLTHFGNPARRVIRLNANKQLTTSALPPGSQVSSPVAPKNSLTTFLTVEDILKYDEEKKVTEPSEPIVNLLTLQKISRIRKTPQPIKDTNLLFRDRIKPIEFFLSLMFRLADQAEGNKEQTYRVRCRFTVTNMPWIDQIPWNPRPD